jgi:hypothetical protein
MAGYKKLSPSEQKIRNKGRKDNIKNVADNELRSQGIAVKKGVPQSKDGAGYAKNSVVASKFVPKTDGSKSSGKVTNHLKRVNQSVVARGGKPGSTVPANVKKKAR